MKKQYEQPMAEKIDFNYRETVVASVANVKVKKDGTFGGNGCYKGNENGSTGCKVQG